MNDFWKKKNSKGPKTSFSTSSKWSTQVTQLTREYWGCVCPHPSEDYKMQWHIGNRYDSVWKRDLIRQKRPKDEKNANIHKYVSFLLEGAAITFVQAGTPNLLYI